MLLSTAGDFGDVGEGPRFDGAGVVPKPHANDGDRGTMMRAIPPRPHHPQLSFFTWGHSPPLVGRRVPNVPRVPSASENKPDQFRSFGALQNLCRNAIDSYAGGHLRQLARLDGPMWVLSRQKFLLIQGLPHCKVIESATDLCLENLL